MSNDIKKIRLQLTKIKNLVKQERDNDKRAIGKLSNQLKSINTSISNLEKMAKRIKGGKVRGLNKKNKRKTKKRKIKKGGNCPLIVEEDQVAGKKKRKKRKKR